MVQLVQRVGIYELVKGMFDCYCDLSLAEEPTAVATGYQTQTPWAAG